MPDAAGLHYLTTGPADAPPLLLLHGFMGSSSEWEEVADALSEDYRLLIPDLPGHGASTGLSYPDAYTMQGASNTLLALLDTEDVTRCAVAGYSMGGRLALYLALRHPERVNRLLLESASPGLATEEERAARRAADERLAQRLETESFQEFVEDWYRQPLFATLARDERLLRRTIESRLHNDPHELARSLRAMGTGSQPSLWEELSNLSVPTLLVVGEEDEKFVRIAREMERVRAEVQVVTIPGAGHSVHAEATGEYMKTVRVLQKNYEWQQRKLERNGSSGASYLPTSIC
ncbi:2-succinyl-6-hydroxy-2,4-cyclohexadiene-1-carboxylate synthase [Rubrobacter aplysinae]|uniref:2-succinyl-6-hydroxy-2, 4-cyclohexadiene-1-carboxylate synthase n=1 Tax=Rubrobacter aplysinae TaxID=909625 RepID=UPI00069DBB6D|nr:2-succinyl-6-hydroxy-2,4-cyclohexadiene-1-carboxylate synthase [Rubrobacter aplysinae]